MTAKRQGKEDVVVWMRLPRPMSVRELQKLGLEGAACYGGDTCIAATSTSSGAGLVVKNDLEQLLIQSKLAPKARCFGGDTCIV